MSNVSSDVGVQNTCPMSVVMLVYRTHMSNVSSDVGVQNTYVRCIKELLRRILGRRLKFTLQYGVLYFHFCVCQDKIVLCSSSYSVVVWKHENEVYT
jgi:hypothetical protein